jgi:hypothetical protein
MKVALVFPEKITYDFTYYYLLQSFIKKLAQKCDLELTLDRLPIFLKNYYNGFKSVSTKVYDVVIFIKTLSNFPITRNTRVVLISNEYQKQRKLVDLYVTCHKSLIDPKIDQQKIFIHSCMCDLPELNIQKNSKKVLLFGDERNHYHSQLLELLQNIANYIDFISIGIDAFPDFVKQQLFIFNLYEFININTLPGFALSYNKRYTNLFALVLSHYGVIPLINEDNPLRFILGNKSLYLPIWYRYLSMRNYLDLTNYDPTGILSKDLESVDSLVNVVLGSGR